MPSPFRACTLCVCRSPPLSSRLALFFPIKQTNKNRQCCLTGGERANMLVIVTCFLFIVPTCTAARFCTQLAPLPYQNHLLQKRKILANLFFKKQTNKTKLTLLPKSPVNILERCTCISLVRAQPQREEFGAGRDEGWCCQHLPVPEGEPWHPKGF